MTSYLHKKEVVLSNKDAEMLRDSVKIAEKVIKEMKSKMNKTPTKTSYEEALETVKKYEKRQEDLAKLNKDLGATLANFPAFKFDVRRNSKEVIFAGVTETGELKLTSSKCVLGDKFEEVIGKLIAAKKAWGEDVKYIEKYVEREGHTMTIDFGKIRNGKTISDHISTNTGGYTGTWR